jgi:hypothetical protein
MGPQDTQLVLGIGLEEVPNRGGAFPRLDDEQRVSLRELGEIRAAQPASDFPELRSTQGARDERLETCSSLRARPRRPLCHGKRKPVSPPISCPRRTRAGSTTRSSADASFALAEQ